MGFFSRLFGKKKQDDSVVTTELIEDKDKFTQDKGDDTAITTDIVSEEVTQSKKESTQEDNEAVFTAEELEKQDNKSILAHADTESAIIDDIAHQVEEAEKKEPSCDSNNLEETHLPQESEAQEASPTVARNNATLVAEVQDSVNDVVNETELKQELSYRSADFIEGSESSDVENEEKHTATKNVTNDKSDDVAETTSKIDLINLSTEDIKEQTIEQNLAQKDSSNQSKSENKLVEEGNTSTVNDNSESKKRRGKKAFKEKALAKELAEQETDNQSALLLENEHNKENVAEVSSEATNNNSKNALVIAEDKAKVKDSFFGRLKRTRDNLAFGVSSLILGRKIDDELYEDLETALLTADLGAETTQFVIDRLRDESRIKDLRDAGALRQNLKKILHEILDPCAIPLDVTQKTPFVILMVGVNGAGKTTTIGKLARKYQDQGLKVMLAAGDTFRVAAVEQLKEWGERANVPVIAQATGADSASVLFDALESAKARGVDVLICDTAGRLQNKSHLMDELRKVVRVLKKIDENVPHETLLVLDAATGQNAVSQTKLFKEAVDVSGLVITKLDGTAKGGVVFALADLYKLPIRYVGIGEKAEDLREFDTSIFIDSLIDDKA